MLIIISVHSINPSQLVLYSDPTYWNFGLGHINTRSQWTSTVEDYNQERTHIDQNSLPQKQATYENTIDQSRIHFVKYRGLSGAASLSKHS